MGIIVLAAMAPSKVQVENREEEVVLASPPRLEKKILMQLMILITVGVRTVMDALTYGIPNI